MKFDLQLNHNFQGSAWTLQAKRMNGDVMGFSIKPDQIQVRYTASTSKTKTQKLVLARVVHNGKQVELIGSYCMEKA